MLADTSAFISGHVVVPEPYLIPVVLWVAHCHRLDVADSTPRLAFMAPEKGCGKSRAQEVLETLVPAPMRSSTVTTAVLFRSIGSDDPPTVFLDEVDAVWTGKGDAEDLRALVNAGHRRGSDALRMSGEGAAMKVTRYPTFAPMCLAGIGDLPDTISDRAVVVPMRRRLPTEPVARWRFRQGQAEGHALRDRLAAALGPLDIPAEPDVPDTINDRAADVWEPLLGIAEAVGGEWLTDALTAAETITSAAPDAVSRGVRLLTDLREVWMPGASAMATADLLTALHALTDSPWGATEHRDALTGKGLSTMLRRYGVRPTRTAAERRYLHADLIDPWQRYCTRSPSQKASLPVTPVTPENSP